MSTATSRPTYAGWLDQLAQQGRTDDLGLAASAWLTARDHGRPRLSSVKSVNAWLSEHPPPGVANLQATLHRLQQGYQQGGLPEAAPGAAQEPLPGMPPPGVVPFQPPDPAMGQPYSGQPAGDQPWLPQEYQQPAEQNAAQWREMPPAPPGYRWSDEDPPQMVADYIQQPAPPAEQADAEAWAGQPPAASYEAWRAEDQPWQQQGPPEHPYQVIMLAIARLESRIDAFWTALAPLVQLAAEAGALDASQVAAASPSEAQARAMQIAQEQGWTAGPAFEDDGAQMPPDGPQEPAAAPVDFYGGHVVTPPDFAQMAAQSDGSEPEQ